MLVHRLHFIILWTAGRVCYALLGLVSFKVKWRLIIWFASVTPTFNPRDRFKVPLALRQRPGTGGASAFRLPGSCSGSPCCCCAAPSRLLTMTGARVANCCGTPLVLPLPWWRAIWRNSAVITAVGGAALWVHRLFPVYRRGHFRLAATKAGTRLSPGDSSSRPRAWRNGQTLLTPDRRLPDQAAW